MKLYSLIFLMMLLWLGGTVRADEGKPRGEPKTKAVFEMIAREQGVTVYQDKDSKNIRVAAEGLVAGTPEEVQQALLDYPKQPGIVKRLTMSEVLDRGPGWLVVYQHLNLPVISDRDYTLRVKWGADGDVRWITYRAITDSIRPKKAGVVRVTDHEGSWELRPFGDGAFTQARFQMSIDLSGWLPRWMARSKAGDEVPDLFLSIRSLVILERKGGSSCISKSC